MTERRTELCELIELYALSALTEEEMHSFEAHLQECPGCTELLIELNHVTDLLPLGSEPIERPAGMKARILSHVLDSDISTDQEVNLQKDTFKSSAMPESLKDTGKQSSQTFSRGSRLWRYTSLGLAAAVIGLIVYTGILRQDVNQLQQQIAISNEPVKSLKVNEVVTLSPATKDIVAKGLATIVIDNRGTHLVVQAENLPELKGTEAYQVWLIKGNATYNAGTFLSHDGNGALYYSFEPQDYDTVAITLEPDPGGVTPRGQIVLAAPIKNG